MLWKIAEENKERLKTYHPFPNIEEREGWLALDERWKAGAISLGEKYLGYHWRTVQATEYLDYTRTGSRACFYRYFFPKMYALLSLVLAECVENQGRFLDDVIDGVYTFCNEPCWNPPAHNFADVSHSGGLMPLPDPENPVIDLMSCETAAMMAGILYLMEPALNRISPMIGKRIRCEISRRVLSPYLVQHAFWMGDGDTKPNNWTSWCTQNVLLAAFFSNDARRKEIMLKACRSLDCFLGAYDTDGCCDEGAGYYRRAALNLYGSLVLLNTVTDNAFSSVYRDEKIRNMAAYIYKTHVKDDYYINFADCTAAPGSVGSKAYQFAKATGNPGMMAYAAREYQRGLPDTMLMEESYSIYDRLLNAFVTAEVRSYPSAETVANADVFYASAGVMIVRDGHYVLAAKAGDNDDSHNHNDVGSIIVYKDGAPLLIDVGPEAYTSKTFSAQRYEIWTMQSSYHNTPEINGQMQLPGEKYRATDVTCNLKEKTISMDIAAAYPAECHIAAYQRKAALLSDGILLQDQFAWQEDTPAEQRQVVLNLMAKGRPTANEPDAAGRQEICIPLEAEAEGAVIHVDGGHVQAVEEIGITDENMLQVWGKAVYRVRILADRDCVCLRIR